MRILYSDNLVEITDQTITFKNYYWKFWYRPRRVHFSELARVEVLHPSVWNGKWKLFGTGDFRTWFPLDWHRPSRDRIFLASLRGTRKRIGFTVVDSARVEQLLREKGLIHNSR